MKEGVCFVCKKKGHLSRQCPEKKKKGLYIRSMVEGLTEEQKQEAIAIFKEEKARTHTKEGKGKAKASIEEVIEDESDF